MNETKRIPLPPKFGEVKDGSLVWTLERQMKPVEGLLGEV